MNKDFKWNYNKVKKKTRFRETYSVENNTYASIYLNSVCVISVPIIIIPCF